MTYLRAAMKVLAYRKREAHGVEPRTERLALVFREHNKALVSFIALRVRSRQEAQDIVQEAYVRLLRLHQQGAVSFVRAFLFKTALNLAIDRIRRARVSHHIGHFELFQDLTAPPTPEQAASDAQELKLVEQAIDELPPKCRRAFMLHKIYGLPFPEVAEQMDLSERMIRIYVVRALTYCFGKLATARSGRQPF